MISRKTQVVLLFALVYSLFTLQLAEVSPMLAVISWVVLLPFRWAFYGWLEARYK